MYLFRSLNYKESPPGLMVVPVDRGSLDLFSAPLPHWVRPFEREKSISAGVAPRGADGRADDETR